MLKWLNFEFNASKLKMRNNIYVMIEMNAVKQLNISNTSPTKKDGSPTDLGPSGGGGGGGGGGSPSRDHDHRDGDPPGPPPPGDPAGGDDPEITEVKISRRDADKVVVPPYPKVTHLDRWMAQCVVNVLSACADPNQEDWMHSWNPPSKHSQTLNT